MKNLRFLFLLILPSMLIAQDRLGDYVDVFIGTGIHAHTFPGPLVPYGAATPGPDCAMRGWDAASGYHWDATSIMGFSQTHLSGTGLIELGDFLLMPTTGEIKLESGTAENPDEGYRSRFSHDDEYAEPGYYQVRLQDYNINVELTASERVAYHRYTFPSSDEAHVMLDMNHHIAGRPGSVNHALVQVIDDRTVTGYRLTSTTWAKSRHMYFAAEFSKPFDSYLMWDGTWKNAYNSMPQHANDIIKTVFNFKTSENEVIEVKIAISAVSMNNALENLRAEIPHWDFNRVRKLARDKWENELGRVQAKGTDEQLKIFYTGLYHNMIHPSIHEDVNGQYRGYDQEVHRSKGFTNHTVFSLWDTFRATHPLFTLIQQRRTNDFIHSMLAHYKESPYGMLPTWSMYHNENWCMIAYHSVPVIADAWKKGLTNAPSEQLLDACISTANFPGFDPAPYPSYIGQMHYLELGYHPNDRIRSGTSVTLETAYDDWTIGYLANMLKEEKIAAQFLERGQNYRNVYDPETMFFRARLLDGKFREPFDPRAYHTEATEDRDYRDYIEGNAWQWLFAVPHDIYSLVDLFGGPGAFVGRLDEMINLPPYDKEIMVGDVSGFIGDLAHGNEPCHHYAYLYNYAGQPWKSQELIHRIATEFYKAEPGGYIGNEDAGQMSAWYVFSAMGFYPVNPAGGIYVIGTPLLEEVSIKLENGRTFKMKAHGVSDKNIYIQSVKLNGVNHDNVWIRHEDIVEGGTLEFKMGAKPSKWGSRTERIPLADGTYKE